MKLPFQHTLDDSIKRLLSLAKNNETANNNEVNEVAIQSYSNSLSASTKKIDRIFVKLMIVQWIAGIICALIISPRTWAGAYSEIHVHLWAAIFMGGAIISLPVYMGLKHSGKTATRHIISIGQVFYSALLIHLTGGRIETHFHVFGSLAFIAFYRDWRVLVTASLVVAIDHFLRGIYWPESVYGILTPEKWRWLEHTGWVVFEDIFLIQACIRGKRELFKISYTGALSKFQVISLQKAQNELELSERKFKKFLEMAPDAIVIVGKNGIIQITNIQTENIFGYSREEMIGQKIEMLIPERFREKHPQHRSNFFSHPNIRPMGAGLELFGLRKNGEEFPVEISLSPLETEEGMLVSAAIRDITDRKKIENELQEYNLKLKSKNKELEQFAYIASHDLQEPLRTVSSFTSFLKETYSEKFDETALKSMDFITEATQRMREFIKGLLDYSRIGKDKKFVIVDCQKVVEDITKDLSSNINAAKAIIKVNNLPKIKASEVEIRQLFQNLISNAVKFRKEGRNPEIEINAKKEDVIWKFAVKDNGIGIEKNQMEKIFVIFQRLHSSDKYEGTGIGLSHCKKIVEIHGGKIWVETNKTGGSTFYFTIPENVN